MVLPQKTNWQNLGGATSREEMPAHNMSCHLPEHLTLESILAERCMSPQEGTLVRPNMDTGKMTGQKQPRKQTTTIRPETEPHGRVLLGSLTLLLSAWMPFHNKVFCFVSVFISLDNSFPSVTQEPTLGPWKESPFW